MPRLLLVKAVFIAACAAFCLCEVASADYNDIRAFHDEILSCGAVPLKVLDSNTRAWVATQKVGH